MKKLATKRRKPPRRKRSAGLRDTRFREVDIDLLRWLLADESPSAEDDLEDMIAAILSAEPDEIDDMPSADTLSELDAALNQTRLDAAGGDADARLTLKNIHAMIDEAAARNEINPAMLMLLGRSFAAAQIEIGGAARAAMGRALDLGGFQASREQAYRAFLQPLSSASRSRPVELNEEIDAVMSIFPLHYKSAFAERLAAETNSLARRTAVGFLLHREEPLAAAAIRGFGAVRGELDDECRRWIETIRPWLAPARRIAIDAALPSAGDDAPRPAANVIKTVASVCDGSGVSFLLATLKRNSRFLVASVMVKPKGVADCMCYEDLSKSEAAEVERALRSAALTSEVTLASWERLLRLALGCNLECDEPPPFALVPIVEALGLDSLAPDPATPVEIIALALADLPGDDQGDRIRAAHEFMAGAELAEHWFEVGEDVEALLGMARAPGEAANVLLDSYLPGRRAFWAAICARSSLALKGAAGSRDETWSRLALVGREILSEVPVSGVPLMRRIAERSALAYFMQRISRPAAA
jgi:hypothetical protein